MSSDKEMFEWLGNNPDKSTNDYQTLKKTEWLQANPDKSINDYEAEDSKSKVNYAPKPIAKPANDQQTKLLKSMQLEQMKKKTWLALLLVLLFGSWGLFYATIKGGIILLVITWSAVFYMMGGVLTGGVSMIYDSWMILLVSRVASFIWASSSVETYNKALEIKLSGVDTTGEDKAKKAEQERLRIALFVIGFVIVLIMYYYS